MIKKIQRLLTLCIVLIFSFTLLLSFPTTKAFANEGSTELKTKQTSNTSFSFDLTKAQKQEYIFTNSEGNATTVGIEPITQPSKSGNVISPLANYGLGYGWSTWKIYWYSIVANISFYIDIYTYSDGTSKIDRAYDPWYLIIGAAVKSAVLQIDRTYETSSYPAQATYYFQFGTPVYDLGGWNGWLRASIKNRVLTTSVK